MTIFLITVVGISIAGWIWAGDLPVAKLTGARVVLALCALMAAGAIAMIWNERTPEQT
ncbi:MULTISPECIES: hypothetical protein [Pirellulaceae]|nr:MULTISPECIES: hypothetical protein [Pirellulaceae]